jgi:hypothetical protein
MIELAQAIVRDGEGATKFMEIRVEGGKDEAECKQVGYAIGRSPLVKTAFFASDPNLGRILAAIGYARHFRPLDVDAASTAHVAGQCAGGGKRRPRGVVSGRGRRARDGRAGNQRARRSGARQHRRYRVDLRFLV